MPPRKYTKYAIDLKKKLIDAINEGKSMELACDVLKIDVRSGQRFYKEYKDHGELLPALPRGGNRLKLLNDEQIEQVRSWIDDDCTISLSLIKGRILWEMLISVSESTIYNYIKAFHYTFKKVAKIANAADTPQLWDDRIIYCQWYREQKLLDKTFIYDVRWYIILFNFRW